jgi:hypothetical protein
VYPGLYHHEALLGKEHPKWQIGEGCLVDQLVGQYMAHICGLGYLADSANIGTAHESIMKYNYRGNMFNHFNNRRSYALGEEAALLMVDYPPHVRKEVNPFIYATETMTGFEYTAAVGMIYEGQIENGLKCIQNIRDRFDGIKRSPFDEAEAGHHYARAMASWSALLALSGFHYSAVEGEIRFDPMEGTNFWSNGYAFGTMAMDRSGGAEMKVLGGEISISRFTINHTESLDLAEPLTLRAGDSRRFAL